MILPAEMEDIEFLQNLGPKYANKIAVLAQLKEYGPGAVVFQEHDECRFIYFILRGSVGLEIEVAPQKTTLVQTLGPGEVLGWSPLLGLHSMTATARTLERCRLAALPTSKLWALCDEDPRFGMSVMRQMAITLANRLKATRLRLCDAEAGQMAACS